MIVVDEMEKEEKSCLLLREIEIPNLGTIHSPTVEEILKIGNKGLNKLLLPFIIDMNTYELNKDYLLEFEKNLKRTPTIFDVMLMDKELEEVLLQSLKFFYKTEDIRFNQGLFGVTCLINFNTNKDNTAIISFSNFNNLCLIIKELMCISGDKKQERIVTVEHEENNAILQEYLRLQKQKEEEDKKLALKNQLTLHDIITIVASDCKWDYDKVFNMTYYRLFNSYNTIIIKENCRTSLMYHTSEKFDTSKMIIKQWTESIKKE